MFAASKTDASVSPPDGQFNYVTMLLHGDGTNGAQNNTFLDSSTNNFSITRTGNTTQGSFSPYGSNWSNNFNGTSDYLSIASNAAFNIGSNDACVELWVNSSNTSDAVYGGQNAGTASTIRVMQYSGTYSFTINNDTVRSSGISITAGSWFHLAVTITGGVARMFVNGILRYYVTGLGSVATNTGAYTIGCEESGASLFLNGYISNYRFVNGSIPTAYQTSSSTTGTTIFTVPTTPLTAVTNTVLLICQSNRFVDNSSNAFTVSVGGGSPSVQRFNPFGTSTAYSTSVIGGSGYFDGSGDYISAGSNSAFAFGTGNYTVEAWVYVTGSNTENNLFCNDTTNGFDIYFNYSNSTTRLEFRGGSNVIAFSGVPRRNSWAHVALVREGTGASQTKLYFNGVLQGSGTDGTNWTVTGPMLIGGIGVGAYLSGYISDARIVKGTAVYTAAFTPPTAPLSAITNTSLLTSFTNGAIFDNAMMNDLETVGNAQISTSVKKYGTGAMYFDGSGDYLKIPSTQNVNLGTGDFTIEFWAYWAGGSFSNYAFAFDSRSGNAPYTDGVGIAANIVTGYWYISFAAQELITTVAATAGWQHIALVRNNGVFTLYINGTSGGTYTASNDMTNTTASIGTYYARSQYYWNGYIDDLRITKGYARYTSSFTAPTAALSDTGPY